MTTTMMHAFAILSTLIVSIESQGFLSIPRDELCASEPNLAMCSGGRGVQAAATDDLRQGFIAEKTDAADDPFADIATRAPELKHSRVEETETQDFGRIRTSPYRKHHSRRPGSYREYYSRLMERYRAQEFQRNLHNGMYNVYPILYPKNKNYCSAMKPNFAFTCQPGKSLRLDLVEFCKDYSAFCNVPNFHRLPGPREGPVPDGSIGHVGVNLGVGFSIGSVPGLEVQAGGGVDVGPIPGMGDNVGVGVGLNLGLLGAKGPEAYRRGMDNPNEKGGGVVGINGGVGVNAPGSGPIGVGSGVGVGR